MTPPSGTPPLRSFLRERALWILGIGTFGFAALPLLLHRIYFFRDLTLWTFPQRRRLVELLRAGATPSWDPYLHGGQPFWGDVTNVALYPTAFLSLIFKPVAAVNLEIALHLALCAVAMYLLARTAGLSSEGALLAGIAFAASGPVLSLVNLFNRLVAAPHMILLILFWRLFLAEGRRRRFAWAAVFGALQLLAGSAEFLVFSFAIAIVWGLVDPPPGHSLGRLRQIRAAALLAVAIVGLAAVQAIPTALLWRDSSRHAGLSEREIGTWSLSWRRLPELAVPGFFGRADTLDEDDYWGLRVEDRRFPLLPSVTLGTPILILAFAGALWRRAGGPLTARTRRFLLATGAVCLLLALGRHFFFSALLMRLWSIAGVFRYPIKVLVPCAFAAALLAAHGAEALLRPSDRKARRAGVAAGLVTLLLIGSALAVFSGSRIGHGMEIAFFTMPIPKSRVALSLCLAQAALFAGLCGLLLAAPRRLSAPRLLGALAAIVAMQLLFSGARANPTAPAALFAHEPPAAALARREIRDGRLFRDSDPAGLTLRAPTNEAVWRVLWQLETLDFYLGAAFDLPVIYHEDFDRLAPVRVAELTQLVRSLPWPRRTPLLSAASVRLVLTSEELPPDRWTRIGEIPNSSDRAFFLYRNERAAPRAGLVHFWKYVASAEEARRAIALQGFDPRWHVALEGSGPAPPAQPCRAATVTFLSSAPNAATLRTDDSCGSYLVFSEPLTRGWRIEVDGSETPILPANGAFSAVFMPPGRHTIMRRYRPAGLFLGAVVTAAAAALLLAYARRP
jgi:hypothetical protein